MCYDCYTLVTVRVLSHFNFSDFRAGGIKDIEQANRGETKGNNMCYTLKNVLVDTHPLRQKRANNTVNNIQYTAQKQL